MYIDKSRFEQYVNAINKVTAATASELEDRLRTVWNSAGAKKYDRTALKETMVKFAEDIAMKYGLASAAVSAAMWEDIYRNDTGHRLEALIPDDGLDGYFGEAAENIVGERIDSGDWDGALNFLVGIATKAVRDSARRTQVNNTRRVRRRNLPGANEAKWARVPVGDDACAFCLLLAGRGFVYESEDTALFTAEGDKYHDHCRCEAIASFSDTSGIEGFDPDKYFQWYEESRTFDAQGRVDLSATLSNMRRKHGLK